MRVLFKSALWATSLTAGAFGQSTPVYLTGGEVRPGQGVFLAMPTSNFPEQTVGPLTVKLQGPRLGSWGAGGPSPVTEPGVPVSVGVWLVNTGAEPLQGTVNARVIDDWRIEPHERVRFELGPHGWKLLWFQASFGPNTYDADYPVHVVVEFDYEGRHKVAHPVLILRPRPAKAQRAVLPLEWKPYSVPARGAFALWRLPLHRQRFSGSEARAFTVPSRVNAEAPLPIQYGVRAMPGAGPEAIRFSLGAAPPRPDRIDQAGAEYPLALPDVGPLVLEFQTSVGGALALPGALFRVRVTPFEAPPAATGEILWERVVKTTAWKREAVDLGKYRGRSVRLVLEAGSEGTGEAFWGEPSIVAGSPASPAPAREYKVLGIAAGYEVRFWPGERGIFDAMVGFAKGSRLLGLRGFAIQVNGDPLQETRTVSELMETREETAGGRLRIVHRFRSWAGPFDLVAELWADGEALMAKFRIDNPPAPRPWLDVHIESVKAGGWSEPLAMVYAGPNAVRQPKTLNVGFSGYGMHTSFVALEFESGTTILQALDESPIGLEVNAADRTASLVSPGAQTMTFLPVSSAWEGAKKWRDRSGLRAASGVADLAGRFAFDLWHGRYAETKRDLERAFRYGMTDSLVVFHNWQHWGYDYRLPDIYPPAEQFGSLAEFRELAQFCREHRVLFAPHDNYIDIYPEAEDFSYDRIAFTPAGEPQTGWYNAAMSSQAYRAIPGRLRPLIERNMRLVRDGFSPNAYFIDVWGSRGGFDYWTRDGKFGDRASALNDMREAFSWIRGYLGGHAPQVTEAGTDQFIGWADGAQAMHAQWRPDAVDVERIPWFDFAYHDRFILHGVGYNERYPAGQDPEEHGVYSDDYMSLEVLVGHPAMVIEPFSRKAVRNYWLLHDLMRGLALKRMDAAEFDGGNLHRQQVRWAGGGQVWVNRGTADWTVNGRTLPQYGYYARVPYKQAAAELAVERMAGGIVEWSRSPDGVYVNPRGRLSDFGDIETAGACRLTLEGRAIHVTALPGNDPFTVKLRWNRLPWKVAEPRQAQALDEGGRVVGRAPVGRDGDAIVLKYQAGVFAYELH